ncbi:RDD family protein [Rathayibacter tanaceti]|uniref:RDD family protein n=2 Tax=Rathayibacter tanaceti TaxID=1671680 RepID=A0A166H421_9MICO|nr:RDD family protein [Rathayibacter tanaceti]KZX19896.1 RDD family protein [Rathayibacter tanaceti]QHC55995.1 RDD family protein [Rathayibacter tanaceti]TCO39160.1 putative RDD family membrane protein YckC [Rathayibacter tanaceti]
MDDQRTDLFDDTDLVTGEAIALEVPVASFVLRAVGAIVDLVAELLLALGLFLLVGSLSGDGGLDPAASAAVAVAALVVSIVIVPVTVETATRGRSLGKLVVGARVVRDDGGSIGFRHALVRGLTGVIEILMTFGGLAAVVGLVSRRSRRLGDVLAGTHSQLERVPRVEPLVVEVPEPLRAWAVTADAARLPDPLARRLAQFLRQREGMTEPSRSLLASALAEETAAFVSPLPAAPAEDFLLAVAALRRAREEGALRLADQRLERLAPVLASTPRGFPERS